ncbi:uncharacterized protein PHALS_08088 [Plasmopara halstedii]|uniref:Uncharacterized protein n=1 Tax=Plasmopara halstedii TaxID=4781 RepID=A0A0P1B6B4_PLAHL|nr:uncharacterized protein PHALS_08088 [Plasmopara halstedii]CEG50376.1 hypothetical protein PHALS_08088 [Plasmopara halstedii]|eukprot:XP_024586745.1 hypothetical protein PHALS_08088 [Plasmopara halstedii]
MNIILKQKRAKRKEKFRVKMWLSAIAAVNDTMSNKIFAVLKANAANKDRMKADKKAASSERIARQAMNAHDKVDHQTEKTRHREKAAKLKARKRASCARGERSNATLKLVMASKTDVPTLREDEIMSAVV